jgi:hypothetical protein
VSVVRCASGSTHNRQVNHGVHGQLQGRRLPRTGARPSVLKYRIAFLVNGSPLTPNTTIIHLVQSNPKDPPPNHLEGVPDLLLNRIVENEFTGVCVDRLHLVLKTDTAFFENPIEYDADVIQKGSYPVIVTRTGEKRTLHIASRDVVGGVAHLCERCHISDMALTSS